MVTMAWFHKTLGDLQKAIKKHNWKKVKEIADEHAKPIRYHHYENELSMAATYLRTYDEKMTNVRRTVSDLRNNLKTPKGGEIDILEISAKEAQEAIQKFELMMQKLIAEGKFEE